MSKLEDASQETLTGADAVIGTIAYMAPEQALGRVQAIGPAADVFALAAVVYRALTGRLAVRAANVLSAIHEVAHVHPPPPSALRPELPRDVDAVLAIGLAKTPEDRYESATALVDDLERAGRGALPRARRERARARRRGRRCRHADRAVGVLRASDERTRTGCATGNRSGRCRAWRAGGGGGPVTVRARARRR
jgi:serine/threonine-protein kinase